jgi:hypothetical protein
MARPRVARGLSALPQNACDVVLSVEHPENLQQLAAGLLIDEVRKHSVEKNLPADEIGAGDPPHA